MFNEIVNNIQTNQNITTGDLTANMGEAPQDDITSMVTRDMSIVDFV